jgi:hypothetical protein
MVFQIGGAAGLSAICRHKPVWQARSAGWPAITIVAQGRAEPRFHKNVAKQLTEYILDS